MCAPLPQPVCGGRPYAGPPPQPSWGVGLDYGDVGRSVAMWQLIVTPPYRPESAGP